MSAREKKLWTLNGNDNLIIYHGSDKAIFVIDFKTNFDDGLNILPLSPHSPLNLWKLFDDDENGDNWISIMEKNEFDRWWCHPPDWEKEFADYSMLSID
jgi:hypothetical protein